MLLGAQLAVGTDDLRSWLGEHALVDQPIQDRFGQPEGGVALPGGGLQGLGRAGRIAAVRFVHLCSMAPAQRVRG